MAHRVVALLVVCALCTQVALARDLTSAGTDRTLNTAGQTCKDRFTQIQTQLYASDATCADLVKKAMNSNDAASCPDGLGGSTVGSRVQQCMSKSADIQAAWITFIKGCEVFNISNRGGEAEASADAKPSCLPRFGSVQEFQSWIGGSSKSSSSSVRLAWAAVAAAAAAAVL